MLSSWKEIAHFFGKGVRTVQRWEKTLDLPIHRPPGAPSNVVLARTSDLEEWMHRGPIARTDSDGVVAADSVSTLPSLEHEIAVLAKSQGITFDLDNEASTEERISALTGVVSRVNTRMAHSATRAA